MSYLKKKLTKKKIQITIYNDKQIFKKRRHTNKILFLIRLSKNHTIYYKKNKWHKNKNSNGSTCIKQNKKPLWKNCFNKRKYIV